MSLLDDFDEQVSLARTYLEDGALFSSARVLRIAADALQVEGEAHDAMLASKAWHAIKRPGSIFGNERNG